MSTRIGLLGCGTVGSALVRSIHGDEGLASRFIIAAVAVRDPSLPRSCDLAGVHLTTDPMAVATRDDVDIVVEVMGGLDPARQVVTAALSRGTPVVTANKALIGSHGRELATLATASDTTVRYEGAVAAGVPLIATLERLVATDRVLHVEAILNGTANFVLTAMHRDGVSRDEAVHAAQARGLAEADPSRDIDGLDAADKLAIVAQVVWDPATQTEDVAYRGIGHLDPTDIAKAQRAGAVWRLVATGHSGKRLTVAPRRLDRRHPLAGVEGADNAIVIHAQRAGTLTLAGPGAGGDTTAAAILRDLQDVVGGNWPRQPLATTRSDDGAHTVS